jgi:hypothetical protein
VRRESEGVSRGQRLQLRARLPLAGRDDGQGGMTPPTLLLGCLRALGGGVSHGTWWTRVSSSAHVLNEFNLNKQKAASDRELLSLESGTVSLDSGLLSLLLLLLTELASSAAAGGAWVDIAGGAHDYTCDKAAATAALCSAANV